jgi:hypothetical protein
MQEGEHEDHGAWERAEFHWKEVGAKAGTRKTCGNLRSTIPRPRHEPSLPAREDMERSFKVAGTRLQRFQPREIAEDFLFSATLSLCECAGVIIPWN